MTLKESKTMLECLSLFCCNNGLLPDEPYKSVQDLVNREPHLIEATLPDGITMDDLKEYLGMT